MSHFVGVGILRIGWLLSIDLKLQQTEMSCLMVLKTKLIVNHFSFWSYKANKSIHQLTLSLYAPRDLYDRAIAFKN